MLIKKPTLSYCTKKEKIKQFTLTKKMSVAIIALTLINKLLKEFYESLYS
jgi:plastocyanin domain-containing protein